MNEKILLDLSAMIIGVAEDLSKIDGTIDKEGRIFLEGRLTAMKDIHNSLSFIVISNDNKED